VPTDIRQEKNMEKNEDSLPVPPPQKRRRSKGLLIALLLGAVGVALAIPVYNHYAVRESTDDAQIEGHLTPISGRVGGTVQEVLIRDNQYVKAGDVLVRIDPSDYQVALARAQADVADSLAALQAARTNVPLTDITARSQVQNAEAALAVAQTGLKASQDQVSTAQARLDAARARVRETEANQIKAESDLERYRQLVAKDEISQRDFDAAKAAATAAKAATDSAHAGVVEAERTVALARSNETTQEARIAQAKAALAGASTVPQQMGVTKARAGSADAKVQLSQAAVERARLDLQYTVIRAPADGIVSRKTVEVGQVIAPGQQLMTLVPLDDLWVVANFKETQLDQMRVGQKVEIKVDAFPDKTFHGHVDSIAGATGAKFSLLPPENATGNYVKVVQRVPVKIVFNPNEDRERLLRPGMSVEPVVLLR
jgi:membrane fusion protein, multidrug efflux system